MKKLSFLLICLLAVTPLAAQNSGAKSVRIVRETQDQNLISNYSGILQPKQDTNGKCGYTDANGQWIIKPQYDGVRSFVEGRAMVVNGNKAGYIDRNNNIIIPIIYQGAADFRGKMAGVKFPTGKWGFIGLMGNTVIEPIYDHVSDFTDDGLAWIKMNNKFGFIDKQGNIVIPPMYEQVGGFADGVSWVVFGGLCGLIDKQNNQILAPKYPMAEPFSNGIALVQNRDAMWGYVDTQGKEVIAPRFTDRNDPALAQLVNTFMAAHWMQAKTVTPEKQTETPKNSDVDRNIPMASQKVSNTFAVIIANENYRRESKVSYALCDGEAFKTYCIKTLGLPEKNVHYFADATLNDIRAGLNWIGQVANAYAGQAKIIFYYAGHGIPDEKTSQAYLLPVDGYGSDVETGYKISDLYARLSEYPAQSVIVFLDACFSGTQRNGEMLASARGVAIKAKTDTPAGNIVVFSAAQNDETAYPYHEKGHGMFTYYLLKKLQTTSGNVTLGELGNYISTNVMRQSIVENSKSQTPTAVPAMSLTESWQSMKLK